MIDVFPFYFLCNVGEIVYLHTAIHEKITLGWRL